ncbi:ankyrin repeat-containing protein [Whalleya microplaca]|nr:ankyrin repeat-containing protein [Whalleya microplaca]
MEPVSMAILPGRLHAVNNEVADLELVLIQVADLAKDRASLPESRYSAIPHLLRRAKTKLKDLDDIIGQLTTTYINSKNFLLGVDACRREHNRLQALQDDIRTVKCSLNIMLGAANSQDMMKIRLDIQAISSITTQSSHDQLALSEKFMTALTGMDDRIERVERMIQTQSQQLQANQFIQVGTSYHTPPPTRKRASPSKVTQSGHPVPGDDFSVRVTPYIVSCHTGCPCCCHSQKRSSTPAILNKLLGRLFVGYAGLPILSPKCDNDECRGSRASQVSMEYWFPSTFWSTIVRMQLHYQPSAGPSLQLETLGVIPDSAQCVSFALGGNIEGLKYPFKRGLASPRDISSTRCYSLLRWALYGKQYDTCTFLVHAGADPNYRPIAASDNTPRVKACHFLLEGNLSVTAVESLRVITKGSDCLGDYIDESHLTRIHRIVLGLSMESLEAEVASHPEDIDKQDAMGRTALVWAAAGGDNRHTTCVHFLLDAGADADPPLPVGVKKGSPLNVAARNTNDPLLIKKLLDFGADVNQCGIDGRTALFQAAKNDNASLAMLLLEYGAEINYTSVTGDTPLTTAITYNSHAVLRLFLQRWHEYSVCPRLQGPHLLEVTALYADHETLKILAATDHFRLKYDRQYLLGDFGAKLRQRPDMTDKLSMAFDELLSAFDEAPDPRLAEESLLESGFMSCLSSRANTFDQNTGGGSYSDDESNDSFQDALDHLPMASACC